MTQQAKPTDFGRTQRFREDWLALATTEPVIEPELPIIDTHIHLWHHATGYRYFVEEFAKDIGGCGHNIEAAIYVECNSMYRASGPSHLRPVGETEFAAGQAAIAASGKYTSTKIAAGIVGYADMMLGDQLDELLDAHIDAANGRFRGIRQRAKWDADPVVKGAVSAEKPGLYLEPEFHRGLKKLAARDLLFEASIYHPQLPDVTEMARQVPDARIVMIHSGSPVGHSSYAGREKEVRDVWLSGMKDLAKCQNTYVKMGGIVMTLAAFDFGKASKPIASEDLAKLWRPYIEPCVELFGPERCMVSSNFPVDKVAFPYGTCWNMFKHIFADYSDAEKQALFSKSASQIYHV
jgi:predicted TIM-barrel fold metal-dependent hydrolase